MNVSLTPELEKFIREKVSSGLYNNASESSRPGESHPEALTEPYVKVSPHTAPPIQPALAVRANARTGRVGSA